MLLLTDATSWTAAQPVETTFSISTNNTDVAIMTTAAYSIFL
jgi:hypothetical protein